VREDDRLQANDFSFHERGQRPDCLGLEKWECCENDRLFWLTPALILPPLQVLERSGMGDDFPFSGNSEFNFVDEFRLLISPGRFAVFKHELNLFMLDTSLLQQSPDSWRCFGIDPAHLRCATGGWAEQIRIHTDSDGPLGDGSRGRSFIVDPTQSVVVIVLCHERERSLGGGVAFVIRVAALVRHMTLARPGCPVPWYSWKGDGTTIEIPGNFQTFVVGTRVLVMGRDWPGDHHFRAYDLSRWGCRAAARVGNGEMERRVMPNPNKMLFPRERVVDVQVSGDSLVVCSVGDSQLNRTGDLCLCEKNTGSPSEIHVWELA